MGCDLTTGFVLEVDFVRRKENEKAMVLSLHPQCHNRSGFVKRARRLFVQTFYLEKLRMWSSLQVAALILFADHQPSYYLSTGHREIPNSLTSPPPQ
mmetsp:Transcript_3098/g.8079  ORF Transcript_3098/g.8079 Transcript_3098/m.8079 type:complete len:97 (+) Transcript_3098:650-940(+)